MKDGYGREIDYLRVSLTDRCNLRCVYCMPENGIENKLPHEAMLTLEEMYQIIKAFVNTGVKKIRFTGGEPLVRLGAVSLIERVSKIEAVREITMTTNGILLEDFIESLKKAGLDRVNISLDTLDKEKYKEITRGGDIQKVKRAIIKAIEYDLNPVKLNTVLIGGFNDDEIEDFVNLTLNYPIDVRFIELMPIGEAQNFAKAKFIPNSTVLTKVSALEKIENEDVHSPAQYYKLPNAMGKVGLINPISCKFCKDCNRVRLTSTGKLKLCLHSDREIDLKKYLHEGQNLEDVISEAILSKEKEHELEKNISIKRNMNEIGG